MALPFQGISTTLSNAIVAMQGACTSLLDLTVGSPLRALLQACAAISNWLQYQCVLVLRATRLATAQGADCDTFGADFGFTRLPGVAASGNVTFARFTATSAALIVPYVNADGSYNIAGASVRTADGSQVYYVTTDTSNSEWSAPQGGYALAANTSSVTVPVNAAAVGVTGNAGANTITLLATAISGIDTVTNAAALVNGLDAETDPQFRARFLLFIGGLRAGTQTAILAAAAAVQQGLILSIPTTVPGSGVSTLYVDNGTGSPPSSLINSVYAAVQAVRALGEQVNVSAPSVVSATISVILTTATGANTGTVYGNVSTAITSFVNGLTMGATLQYTRLAYITFNADPNVASIASLTINGGSADLTATASQAIRVSSVSVT